MPTSEKPGRKRRKRNPKGVMTLLQQKMLGSFIQTHSAKQTAEDLGCDYGGVLNFLKSPLGQLELLKLRREVVDHTKYDVQQAMKHMQEAALFAEATENATALVRARELMMKLHGLLIERIDQRQVGNFNLNIEGIDPPKLIAKVIDVPVKEITHQDVFDDGD